MFLKEFLFLFLGFKASSYYITAVWAFMCWRASISMFLTSRKYLKLNLPYIDSYVSS